MQRMGIAAHIVLAEQEAPNTNWLDNGKLGLERKLFLRELVARFSYLNAVKCGPATLLVRTPARTDRRRQG
jgi:hypothetical protein